MDKYELKVSIDEIDRLIAARRFREAAEIADTIDWTRVRSMSLICRISDLYKINKRYADSRDLLEIAYEKNPSNRKVIYSLCELELKLNNYIHALQLYNAFINVAPRDSDRYLLQYKLYKKQDVNVREQIAVLEEFLQHDFRERWAYELATLYLRAEETDRCISQCDEIVTYFGDGRFVIRALELKKTLTRLTPQQEERLEILKSGGTIAPPAPAPEAGKAEEEPVPAPKAGKAEGGQNPAPEAGKAKEEERAPAPKAWKAEEGQAPALKAGKAEEGQVPALKAGKAEEGPVPAPKAGKAEGGQAPALKAGKAEERQKGNSAQAPESREGAGTAAAAGTGTAKSEDAEPAEAGPVSGDTRPMPVMSRTRRDDASERPTYASTASERPAYTKTVSEGPADAEPVSPVPAAYRGGTEEAGEEEDGGEPAVTPEEYTDALLRDVNMQETIARGMREIDEYDSVLAQETSGQFTMVMEEDPPEEAQVEGQIDLEQIMSEWEKIRKESEQQRLAQARRRVLERSEEAKRQLYGDSAAGRSAGISGNPQDNAAGRKAPDSTGSTRSWKREDVEKGLQSQESMPVRTKQKDQA